MASMRLDKFLADLRIGTRKEIKGYIRAGEVTVNGQTATDAGMKVDGTATVTFRGETLQYAEFEYYMMNKPAGVISASDDPKQQTVVDLLDDRRRRDLFPVGRLDKDTVGLLLITNDGQLAHELLSPRHHVDKVYEARVSGKVDDADVKAFADGLYVDESLTALPAGLEIVSCDNTAEGWISHVRVTIREGKFHQIKRMFEARGKEVVYLKRLAMGSLVLDESLQEGEYRKLSKEELEALL